MSSKSLVHRPLIEVIKSDARKILREPFFWLVLLAPFMLGYGMRYFLPYLSNQFTSFELEEYYPIIVALLLLTSPLYYGIVLALQILEEKGEGALLAVAVSPLSLYAFLAARIAAFTLVSLPIVVLVHELIGVVDIAVGRLLLVAFAAALNTPMLVLLLASIARNQLEGLVMSKALGFTILFPLATFFVPDYWHLLCGVLPTYWPIIAYFTAVDETASAAFFYFAIFMALVTQCAANAFLYRRFENDLVAG